jgi:hypothetical protein
VTSETHPLGAIVGPARSGTTWVGALVDSCPQVIYRFEPFHRLAAVNQAVGVWMAKLKNQEVADADVPAIYSALRPAHPLTDKAPFFPHKAYPLRTFGKRQLWPLARLVAPVSSIYRAAYSPAAGPPLIFKEVTFVRQLRNLLERTSVPVVYLVRHPCATVLSGMNAPKGGSIASEHLRLRDALRKNAPDMLERYGSVIDGTDLVSQRALMWLYEVETCVALVQKSRHGMIMTYEQLVDDAYLHGEALLRHFGLEIGAPTRRFIDGLYGIDSHGSGKPQRTGWGSAYYSVYRNPGDLKDMWKSKMTAGDRVKVEKVVRDRPAVEYCASLGCWW